MKGMGPVDIVRVVEGDLKMSGVVYYHYHGGEEVSDSYLEGWAKAIKDVQPHVPRAGQGNVFDPSQEPYQSLAQLTKSRNSLVQFKRRYQKVHQTGKRTAARLESDLSRKFVRDLPARLEQLIRELCEATTLSIPPWLTSKTGWRL